MTVAHAVKAYLFLTSAPRQNYLCMCVAVYHGMRTARSARSDSVHYTFPMHAHPRADAYI